MGPVLLRGGTAVPQSFGSPGSYSLNCGLIRLSFSSRSSLFPALGFVSDPHFRGRIDARRVGEDREGQCPRFTTKKRHKGLASFGE